uniref:Lipoxygenase n=2 Tax=Oryza TaxID=4527 RepID=A7LLU3_ORYSJ|nr:lipoxygenase-1 [Oryza sativa Japonica Group]ABS72448.1 lipoxygenase-1 [Oryza sativa Japonica Group]
MLGGLKDKLTGKNGNKIKGLAVLMSRKLLDPRDFTASLLDNVHEVFGNSITCQLVSATVADQNNEGRGIVGSEANLEQGLTDLPSVSQGESKLTVRFNWEMDKHGVPGAIIIKNHHSTKFFLKTITLHDVPGCDTIVFVANSWIYPVGKYHYNRIFFANNIFLSCLRLSQMPEALRPYREDELRYLRGEDRQGPYQEHDRIYRYDVYNDLGEPDRDNPRPVLGGSQKHPYPRRGRTGRIPTKKDPNSESRLSLLEQIYVPSDERFAHLKMSDFAGYSIKAIVQGILPAIRTYVDLTPGEFDSFEDILKLYRGGLKLPSIPALEELRKSFPVQLIKDLLPVGGSYLLKFPKPDIIKENEVAWRTDEEFAREILAGLNPMVIRRLTEFPPKSTLDPSKYGDQTSTITPAHIEKNLEGLSVQQALDSNRLYILDHHDHFMPFLIDINSLDGIFTYATRTLLFLRDDDTLKPLAIELSLPHIEGNLTSAKSKVHTPASSGIESWVWQLAKAYVAVNDSGWHQLISHWLNTHAVMEPFVIATNRQLSVTHPVYKLLQPHYRDTMTINALARQTLINGGGIFEQTVFPGKHALAMSSAVYKNWNFTEQGLPDDLIKRGIAIKDPSSPSKVKLLIKDYPYATDGLAIWQAIEQWVTEYCAIYYPNDGVLQGDVELQAWWKEVREVGHGDLKDADWWPKMQSLPELTKACTTIIWIASALHAAVNFGQYPYAGYLPNRPTISRRPMPEPGSKEYTELDENPEKFFIRTITSQFQTILGVSLIEILSKHSADEIYLGQRDTPEWTSDPKALEAFKRFSRQLVEIESKVLNMNKDPLLKNRVGPANFPYTLMFPNTSDNKGAAEGITARGIPNSISI